MGGTKGKIFKIVKFMLKANQRQKFESFNKAGPQKKSVARRD